MKKQYRIRIEHDQDAESPREWCNLGTMVCWHGRYRLGDEQPGDSPLEWQLQLAEEFEPGIEGRVERFAERLWSKLDQRDDLSLEGKLESHAEGVGEYQAEKVVGILDRHVITLPLYLYDHSGITMSTAGFSCPWDSGQVGFIYARIADIKQEHGWKLLTRKRRAQVEDWLRSEVSVYAQYLEGSVYGFILESRPAEAFDEDGDPIDLTDDDLWEQEDGCWGFYGSDPFENGMAEHIEEEHHHLLKEAA